MKDRKTVLVFTLLIICFLALYSCELENPWMREILNFKTVSFNTNGGGYIPSQDLILDETVKRPPDPSKADFVFGGWYTDNGSFNSLWDFDIVPNSNMTLYAKWDMSDPIVDIPEIPEPAIPDTFTVTFNSNGGSTVNTITVESGNTIAKPTDPTKTGYDVFTGWYEQNLTTVFDFDTPITADITLYAKWQQYKLGDTGPGGGKIFYRSDEEGFIITYDNSIAHYLEAAPVDIDINGGIQWATSNFTSTDISGTAEKIGTGRENTRLIVVKIGSNAPATEACFEYNNGKSDWFLPSIEELEQLYMNKNLVDNLNGFYWSSSQYDDSTAYILLIDNFGFGNGDPDIDDKSFYGSVRPVRAF